MSEWYFAKDDEPFGPVSTADLKQLAAVGLLQPTDLVWKNGMQAWQPASKLKGLPAAAAPCPPPLPSDQPEETSTIDGTGHLPHRGRGNKQMTALAGVIRKPLLVGWLSLAAILIAGSYFWINSHGGTERSLGSIPQAPSDWFDPKHRVSRPRFDGPFSGQVWVEGKGWVSPKDVPPPGSLTEDVFEKHFSHFVSAKAANYADPTTTYPSGFSEPGTRVVAGATNGDRTLVVRRTQDNRPLNFFVETRFLRPRSDGPPPGAVADELPGTSTASTTQSSTTTSTSEKFRPNVPQQAFPRDDAIREIKELGGSVNSGSFRSERYVTVSWYLASNRGDFTFASLDQERLNNLPDLLTKIVEPGVVVHLDLRNTKGVSVLLEALDGNAHVTQIDLGSSDVSDADLPAIGDFPQLQTLRLYSTAITDEGVKHLLRMPRLSSLSLMLTKGVTDAAVPDLERLTSLDELNVRSTSITRAAGQRLKANLPNAKVQY